jgi:hypothetical protein
MIDIKQFDPRIAYDAMRVSYAAYLISTKAVQLLLPDASHIDWIEDEKTDTQVLLVVIGDYAYAAVRGTQFSENFSAIDTLRNARFIKTKFYNYGYAHSGYKDGVNSVVGQVVYWVDKMRADGKTVIGTGHSLGGATVSGMSAIVDFDATYTFGAPRFGNREFAKHLANRNVYRIVLEQDIAPSYPAAWLRYKHGGQRWQLSHNGSYAQIDGWSKDFFHYPYISGKNDHVPAKYLAATRKGLKNV